MGHFPLWRRADGRMSPLGGAVGRRRDLFYLYAARVARGFGDGFASILLPAYLSELGFDGFQIGVVTAAALLGSALITLAIGFFSPHYHQRTLLMVCAALMIVTGVGIPSVRGFAFVVLVVFIGTINPTTGDVGYHVPLEQASLAQRVSDDDRTRIFARYSLIGALAIAVGALAAGTPDLLSASFGLSRADAIRLMFYLYAVLGVASAVLYAHLPAASEREAAKRDGAALGRSRRTVYKLAALFSLDSFAGGFTVQSLLALWLFKRFDLSLAIASAFFFWSNLLSAFSYPLAARLSKRFGLVNTMVFTHLPASICLILAAFSSDLFIVFGLLLVRAVFSQMDVPTRNSYVMAVVTPAERTAAASFTAVPRSLASAASPPLSGMLLATAYPGVPLVISASLKIVYDVVLLVSFRRERPPEERKAQRSPAAKED
jgi:MFS family permease